MRVHEWREAEQLRLLQRVLRSAGGPQAVFGTTCLVGGIEPEMCDRVHYSQNSIASAFREGRGLRRWCTL